MIKFHIRMNMENDENNNLINSKNNNLEPSTTFNSPSFTCPDGKEISPPTPTPTLDLAGPSGTKNEPFLPSVKYHQKPRKKRTQLVKIDEHGGVNAKPKCARKPNPDAPKITKPCTECGKKFWSWKALFGHMRCHPEREWRGINPPPNFRQASTTSGPTKPISLWMSEEDNEVATCLLMLANGPSSVASDQSPTVTNSCNNIATSTQGTMESDNNNIVVGAALMGYGEFDENARFECSSCKKVFGSHQALGGHRASHKNVKGCFAITKNDGEEEDRILGEGEEEDKMLMAFGHKCSICLRVFSSGQALGGHKRCHWEKGDEPSGLTTQDLNGFSAKEGCGLDLNLPAPVEDYDSSCSYSSGLALDLRLGRQ
ncbi:hypothetical protein ACH5RR_035048 [Cinchona calisaya]|uniref:C2H2-type domain-containing protein n=1 Tax=Cinchona calisaya TaxID=153742 RepID=A0ABD2YFQ4_9GENT